MKKLSLISVIIISIVLIQFRLTQSGIVEDRPLKITTWDAFGYYVYLPSIFIYNDFKQLEWLQSIDEKYEVTGGDGWQAIKLENGNYTFKYLGGVAIMELPLFFIGHFIALNSDFPADGFSPPYQYALGFGIIVYIILSLLLLRKILLGYFSDFTTALTLLLVCLASNFIQYAAVDNAQSHAYIFPLYVIILFATIRWHQKPKLLWAGIIGYTIGLATMSRPTEAIMLFIPLLWNTNTKDAAKRKWNLVRENKSHVLFAALFGFIGVLPQLIYWKISTGSFIYDVGSKWLFLNPYFRVLFGWEKGWFIYTPVTVFFVAGFFFLRKWPFKNSVLWFCLLNIWIIIAWSDWRYGGSYSTRALMQSYPVFALSLGALIENIKAVRWKVGFLILGSYLIFVNLFQVHQYSKTILHFNDMNRKYYGRIYLNPNPSPLDMSLLDTEEFLHNEKAYKKQLLNESNEKRPVEFSAQDSAVLLSLRIADTRPDERWLQVETEIKAPDHLWNSYLNAALRIEDTVKRTSIRLYRPLAKNAAANKYTFYFKVPADFSGGIFEIYLTASGDFRGEVNRISVMEFEK